MEVAALQNFLVSIGLLSSDAVTGYFGPLTEGAVQKFQTSKGIVSGGTPETTGYGKVGPGTRAAIAVACTAPAIAPTSTSVSESPSLTPTPALQTSSVSVSTNGVSYPQGASIIGTWSIPLATSMLDWVGIVKEGGVWDGTLSGGKSWFFTNAAKSGSKALAAPMSPGSYQLVYVGNTTGSEKIIGRSPAFSVLASVAPTLSANPPAPQTLSMSCLSRSNSGPVSAIADGQVIENLTIYANGAPGISINGKKGVIIRNVAIHHQGGAGIDIYNSTDTTIQNVDISNEGRPAGNYDSSRVNSNIQCGSSSGLSITNARLWGGGPHAISLNGCPNSSMRNIEGRYGATISIANGSNNSSLEDFSLESNGVPTYGDIVNAFASSNITIRRGYIDSDNLTVVLSSGQGVTIDQFAHDVTVTDVDILDQNNTCVGMFEAASVGQGAPYNMRFDNVRCRNPLTHVIWRQASFSTPVAVEDVDFTPRTPIRAQYCSTGSSPQAQDWVGIVVDGQGYGSYPSLAGRKVWEYTGIGGNTPTTVATNKTSYAPGESVVVSWANQHSGSASLLAPTIPGTYRILYFPSTDQSGTGAPVATSATFTVTGSVSVPSTATSIAVATVTLDKQQYVPGANIVVSWSNPGTVQTQDWVGLVVAGQKYGSVVSQGQGKTWSYTGAAQSGTTYLTAPGAGSYQVVYFPAENTSGSGTPIATSPTFTVSNVSVSNDLQLANALAALEVAIAALKMLLVR